MMLKLLLKGAFVKEVHLSELNALKILKYMFKKNCK